MSKAIRLFMHYATAGWRMDWTVSLSRAIEYTTNKFLTQLKRALRLSNDFQELALWWAETIKFTFDGLRTSINHRALAIINQIHSIVVDWVISLLHCAPEKSLSTCRILTSHDATTESLASGHKTNRKCKSQRRREINDRWRRWWGISRSMTEDIIVVH